MNQINKVKAKSTIQTEDDEEKPWVAYLKSLRIPVMCPLHRKILLTITNFISKNKITGKDRRERINSRVVARKTVNKNPN